MTLEPYPELDLPDSHPLPQKRAFKCSDCGAFVYPPNPDDGCPVCAEDDE